MKRKTMTNRVTALVCALSMILTIFVGVPLPTFAQSDTNTTQNETNVSAKDEIKTIYAYGATGGEASWESGEIATVTKKYFAVSFTMNAAEYGGIIADNGCCGLMFGDYDDNCIFIPYEGTYNDTQRGIGIFGSAKVAFGKWWGTPDFGATSTVDISEYVGKDVTILVLGTVNDDGTTTLTAYINGKQVNVWGNQEEATAYFNGRLQWTLRLNNSSAVCKFTESDDIILPTVFDDEACEHTYGDDWYFSSNSHWRKCTKCGSAVDRAAHTYSSDTDEICDICEQETRHVNHVPSSEWSFSGTDHWHECTKCDNVLDQSKHVFDNNGTCTVCGAKKRSENNLSINDGTYTIIDDCQWGTLVLGESVNWEVTMTLKNMAENAEYGLQICGKDDNGDGLILEYDDSFLQVFLTGNDTIRLIGCDNGWGNVPGYQWDHINRTTGYGAQDDLTLTVKLNGNQLSFFVDGIQRGDTIVLDDSVMFGNVVTLFMKHIDTSISNVTFKDNTCSVHTYGDEWFFSFANHWRKCTKCGFTVDRAAHTYSSDTDEICDICEQETRHVNHVPSSEWSFSGTDHWHECTKCDNMLDQSKHVFDNNGTCTICGAKAANDSDIKTIYAYGATDGEASWESGEIATVTKKYFAVSFTMNAAEYAGIPADNGNCGLMFGDYDDTCIFIPYDEGNTDTQRKIGIWGSAHVMFGKWWGTSVFGVQQRTNIDEYVDKDVTILVLGTVNDDGTTTLTAYINGKQVNVWGNQEEATAYFNGRLQWTLRLNNSSAVCKFTESDNIILPTVFDEKCEHTFGRWTANVDGHFRTCTKCGEADSGTHVYDGDLFYNSGAHYYACTVCSIYRLVYEHDLKMRIDQIAHQSYCTECPYVSELTEHTWGDDGYCSICGSKKPANPMGFCGADGSNMTWELDLETGLLTINGKGEMGNTLPWREYMDTIKIVEIGEGVTSIADGAFLGCTALETAILPKSLEKIGDQAFADCVNLTFAGSVQKTVFSLFSRARVIEPETSLKAIGKGAFSRCVKLQSFDIPTELEVIGDMAFADCKSMESVVVPKTTVYGGSGTFSGCTSLKNVEFAEGTGISMNMFSDCTSLETIELPSDIESIPTGAFNGCTSLREIALPDTVERISKDAFNGCTSLESIELPETIKKVEDGAFGECTSLEKIVVNGKDTEFENASATIPENSVIYCAPDAKVLEYTTENVREVVIDEHEHSGGTYEHNSDKHWYTCTDCGNPYNIAVHVYDDACDTTCNICGIVREPLHDWSDAWSSDADSHWHECTLCGEKIDLNIHTYDDVCDGDCNICGRVREPLHAWLDAWSSDADSHWHACTLCGEKIDLNIHTYDDVCDGDCNICGRVREPLHDWSDAWSSDADSHWHECTLCGQKRDVAKHDFVGDDGECECGQLPFIYGDANGDGKVTSADIIMIKKYIANYDKSTNTSTVNVFVGADANGDGKINSSDVILLKKYIANLDKDGNSSVILGKMA